MVEVELYDELVKLFYDTRNQQLNICVKGVLWLLGMKWICKNTISIKVVVSEKPNWVILSNCLQKRSGCDQYFLEKLMLLFQGKFVAHILKFLLGV